MILKKRVAYCVLRESDISRNTQHALSNNRKLPKLIISFLPILVLLTIAACGGDANAEPVPPQIHYGEDVCEFCGMIVSEERFAGGYTTSDGQQHIFDDIGDMVQAYLQNGGNIAAAFVHDYNDHTWIKAETAYYVQNKDFPTPMLSGIAAFTKQEQANAFANEQGGNVFNFEEMLAEYR